MTIINNGEIYFSKNLSKEQQDTILALFNPAREDAYFFYEATLRFDEYRGSDLLDELNSILAYCEEWDIEVSDSSEISYYGDYDGGYGLRDGVFVELSDGEVGVSNASNFELKSELARREGKLCLRVSGNCDAQDNYITLSRAEVRAAYCYMQQEFLISDAIAAVERYVENDSEKTAQFEKLCERFYKSKHPAAAVLRNGQLIKKIVRAYEKYEDSNVSAAATWESAVTSVFSALMKEE